MTIAVIGAVGDGVDAVHLAGGTVQAADVWAEAVASRASAANPDHVRRGSAAVSSAARLGTGTAASDEAGDEAIRPFRVHTPEAALVDLRRTHGWPGSVFELLKVIGPLTDPTAHGGRAEDAFDVVIPSLPGYGFSERPQVTGWNTDHIARAWAELMNRLGYTRYVAQGGDVGAIVDNAMGRQAPAGQLGIHLNLPATVPPVGYALTDSPAGLAAWILVHPGFAQWSYGGTPGGSPTRDDVLDDITLYWLTNTAASSARSYWDNGGGSPISAAAQRTAEISLPVAISVFPEDVYRPPERWARRAYHNLVYFHEVDKGGHFAAWERPELFAAELREAFRPLRRQVGTAAGLGRGPSE